MEKKNIRRLFFVFFTQKRYFFSIIIGAFVASSLLCSDMAIPSTVARDTIGNAIYSLRNNTNPLQREGTTRLLAITVPVVAVVDTINDSTMMTRALYRRFTSEDAIEKRLSSMTASYLAKKAARSALVAIVAAPIGIVSPTTITKHLGCYTDSIFPRTDPAIFDSIYQTLATLDDLFSQNEVPYWAVAGTTLGTMRHGRIIPWDDDSDIAFLEEDDEKVRDFEKKLNSRGYEMLPCWFGYKIFHKDGLDVGEKYRYPFVDLFPMKEIDGRIVYAKTRARLLWSGEFFLPDEINTLQRHAFGPLTIPIAQNPERYLAEAYGVDWNTHGYLFVNQHDGSIHIPIRYPVRIVMDDMPHTDMTTEGK